MTRADNDADKSVEWVLPASIPFSELKARDLEECVYWLFDALGAKDLEWRTGGSGSGAADGGRDLEAHFYTPSVDDELEPKVWWVECKGRSGTVEKSEIQEACNNAIARDDLDYLVIATNTQFSNPTRDWVKEWQAKHKKTKSKALGQRAYGEIAFQASGCGSETDRGRAQSSGPRTGDGGSLLESAGVLTTRFSQRHLEAAQERRILTNEHFCRHFQ